MNIFFIFWLILYCRFNTELAVLIIVNFVFFFQGYRTAGMGKVFHDGEEVNLYIYGRRWCGVGVVRAVNRVSGFVNGVCVCWGRVGVLVCVCV